MHRVLSHLTPSLRVDDDTYNSYADNMDDWDLQGERMRRTDPFGRPADARANSADALLQDLRTILEEVYLAGSNQDLEGAIECDVALRRMSDAIERRVTLEVANVLAANAAAYQKAAGVPELGPVGAFDGPAGKRVPVSEVLPTLPYDEAKPTAIQAVFRLLASRPEDVVRRAEMVKAAKAIGKTEVTADAARRRLLAAGLVNGRLGRYHLSEEGRNVARSIAKKDTDR